MKKIYQYKNNKGFTLIELTIVIAIIAIMAAIVLVNLQSSRQKGEDTKREQDMKAVSTAIELYGEKNKYDYSGLVSGTITGSHSDTNCKLFDYVAGQLVTLKYLPTVPVDPRDLSAGPTCYKMWTTNDATYGTVIAVFALEWQKYKIANATAYNRKAGFVVSKSGDSLTVGSAVSCPSFAFPIFDPTVYPFSAGSSCIGTTPADFMLGGVSAGQ